MAASFDSAPVEEPVEETVNEPVEEQDVPYSE